MYLKQFLLNFFLYFGVMFLGAAFTPVLVDCFDCEITLIIAEKILFVLFYLNTCLILKPSHNLV